MRNYRKKNKRAKTSSTKQRPAQSVPQPMSVTQNKASMATAKGTMRPRGKSAKPAAAKPVAKPATPPEGDESSGEDEDVDTSDAAVKVVTKTRRGGEKEDEGTTQPVRKARTAAKTGAAKPAAKPVAKPAAPPEGDESSGEDEVVTKTRRGKTGAAKPAAAKPVAQTSTEKEDGSERDAEEEAENPPIAKKQKVTAKPAVEIDAAKIVAETIAGAAAVKSTTGSTEVEEDSTVDSSASTSSTDKLYA